MDTTTIGRKAEVLVRTWLERNGWLCLEQNARTRFFELDLVMQEQATIVFVEVKYRQQQSYGGGASAITRDKKRRLISGAQAWLAEQNIWDKAVRFDVIIITQTPNGAKLQHLRDCLWKDTIW